MCPCPAETICVDERMVVLVCGVFVLIPPTQPISGDYNTHNTSWEKPTFNVTFESAPVQMMYYHHSSPQVCFF